MKIVSIPYDWKHSHLSENLLCKPDYGINAASVEFSDSLPAYIRITDISDDGLFLPDKKTSVKNLYSKDYLLAVGDVVVARTGASVGKTYLYNKNDGPLVFAGFLIRMKPNGTTLDSRFLNLYMHSKKYFRWVKETSTRSGQPGINSVEYASMPILLPPLAEQNRIVAVLEVWDGAIEKLMRKIEIKKQIKKGLLQGLLTGGARLAGFNDKWKEVKFGSLFDERSERGTAGLGLLSITADRGIILQSDSKKKDNSNTNKSKYLRIRPGDIGYNTMRMWQGRSALSYLDGLVSPAYTILAPKEEVDSRYFAYLFKMPRIINYFFQKSQGLVSDTWQCRYKDFSLVKYFVPIHKEQTAIANILTAADDEIAALEKKLNILKDQKKYLLNNLITGAIRTPEDLTIYT